MRKRSRILIFAKVFSRNNFAPAFFSHGAFPSVFQKKSTCNFAQVLFLSVVSRSALRGYEFGLRILNFPFSSLDLTFLADDGILNISNTVGVRTHFFWRAYARKAGRPSLICCPAHIPYTTVKVVLRCMRPLASASPVTAYTAVTLKTQAAAAASPSDA